MKKLLTMIGVFMLVGCASKVDTCNLKKQSCMVECKISHLDEGVKYKACIVKCYTLYSACKTGKAVKKGYEKTKEYIKEKTN